MTMIAQPKTIKEAIRAASERYIHGQRVPDVERIKILKKVLETGEACQDTINKYKTLS